MHLVYHGLNPDFARLVAGDRAVAARRAVPRRQRRADGREEGLRRARRGGRPCAAAGHRRPADAGRRAGPGRRRSSTSSIAAPRPRRGVVERSRTAQPAGTARAARASATSSPSPAASPATATATASPTCSSRRWPPGVPVVSTRVSGIPELVTDGHDGLLVAPEDPEALADALGRLAAEPATRATARRGRAGDRRHALRRRRPRPRAGRADGSAAVIGVRASPGRGRSSASSTTRGAISPSPVTSSPGGSPTTASRSTLGHVPDWLAGGLDADVEWRAEWVKANEGLDLAHAYAVTGDDAYVRAWERLVASYIAQVPVGHDRTEVSARRMQNWLYAWQRFRDAGAAVDPDLVGDDGRPAAPRRRPPRRPPDARAQPPHARAVRAAARRAGARRPRAGVAGARPISPPTPSRTCCPTASTASGRATTT